MKIFLFIVMLISFLLGSCNPSWGPYALIGILIIGCAWALLPSGLASISQKEPVAQNAVTVRPDPKYKAGDRLVLMDENPDYTIPYDDNMVVELDPEWFEYDKHPNGGYWQYWIIGKANPSPEDFLTPYVEGQKEYTVELPCHVYYRQRKNI